MYNFAKKLGIVSFIGYQSRSTIIEYYRNYSLINNSDIESFPLPFMEAALVGTPIVSSAHDYAIEILSNNEAAFLFKTGDMNEMFKCMKKAFDFRPSHTVDCHMIKDNTWKKVFDLL